MFLKIFLVLTCVEVLPSTINYFLSFFYWPVNCASLVYKLYVIFQTRSNMQACLCYNVLVLNYREISRVCHFFGHFGMSLNCRSWVLQITQHIPDKGRNWSNIYAWGFFGIVIYESSILTNQYVLALFVSSVNCSSLTLKL